MFGYVTPCKMELKIKDYEKFKAYYCGLCHAIKNTLGNIPRVSLNYDMTFLALILDSLNDNAPNYSKHNCAMHGFRKKVLVEGNHCLEYAAFCNVILSYYKLLDNVGDDNSIKDRMLSLFFKKYLKRIPSHLKNHLIFIENTLNNLHSLELSKEKNSIDQIAQPFSELTAFILSSYSNDDNKQDLYWLGYNLGKWIYIIDAWDDLEEDIKNNKFNPINNCFNKDRLPYKDFSKSIEHRIDFILGTCAAQCVHFLNRLPLKKNEDLLFNILQYGLLEKMDKVFKRSVCKDEKSL